MIRGAITAILGSFPAAALVALVYRFPIPFDDTRQAGSGIDGLSLTMFAVLFYGALGGFVVLGVLGALAGAVGQTRAGTDRVKAVRLTTVLALAASLACAIFLATLDLFIGPW
jgi:quinol-cytochrome oxidoreductase complex cytochrome b subunit